MGADKSSAASNQKSQTSSSKLLIVIAVMSSDLTASVDTRIMSVIVGFGPAIILRVRIIPIGVVIVRRAGVNGVQNDTQYPAFHAQKQVAGASESFLRSLPAAHHQKNTIRLHRQNYGIGCGHDWRRVDHDKLKLC